MPIINDNLAMTQYYTMFSDIFNFSLIYRYIYVFFYIYFLYIFNFCIFAMFFNSLCISAFEQGHLEPLRYINIFIIILFHLLSWLMLASSTSHGRPLLAASICPGRPHRGLMETYFHLSIHLVIRTQILDCFVLLRLYLL